MPDLAVSSILTMSAGRNYLTETGWVGRDCYRVAVVPSCRIMRVFHVNVLGEVGHSITCGIFCFF